MSELNQEQPPLAAPARGLRVLFLLESSFPNLGVCGLISVLEQQGHHCDLIIAAEDRHFWDSLLSFQPDVVGFSFMTGGQIWAREQAARLRRELPKVHVLFGGAHPTLFPEMIEDCDIDALCRGEAEEALPEYLEALAGGRDPSGTRNFWVRAPQGIVRNPLRPLIQDLDALPPVNREVFQKYEFTREWDSYFMADRGCPYRCSFCANPQFMRLHQGGGRFVRRRSPESMIAEMLAVHQVRPLKEAIFFDEMFALNRSWVERFLTLYREQIGVPLVCSIGVNRTGPEMIQLLKAANCQMVIFGVESGNQRLRHDVLKKPFRDRDLQYTAACLRAAGIPFMTTNIMGLPGETLAQAWETVDFNVRLRPSVAVASLLQPYPKTEIHDLAVDLGLVEPVHPDSLAPNLYAGSMLDQPQIRHVKNLQRLFTLLVKYPVFRPLARALVLLPPNPLFEAVFFAGFAYYQKVFWRRGLASIFAYGLRNIRLFLKQNKALSRSRSCPAPLLRKQALDSHRRREHSHG